MWTQCLSRSRSHLSKRMWRNSVEMSDFVVHLIRTQAHKVSELQEIRHTNAFKHTSDALCLLDEYDSTTEVIRP